MPFWLPCNNYPIHRQYAEARQIVDRAASVREIDVPAVYETISQQVKVADARTDRRSILCESNATPTKILEIKQALKTAGFDPGRLDGVIRADVMNAVNRYQQSKNLPVDGFGYFNIATVKSLGISTTN